MEILIYNKQKVSERYTFKPQDLDLVKKTMYNNNIKWYIIIQSDKEILEYQQLSKRHN